MTKPKTWADRERSLDMGLAAPPADHPHGPGRRSPRRRMGFRYLVLRKRP
jgi:hypothetical protein